VAERLAALTGASGFLGRYVAVALADRGFRLRILARGDLPHSLWPNLAPEVVRSDLDDAAALGRLVRGADVVVHLAGLVRARSRREFLRVNRDGAARLAQAVRDLAPAAHLIGVSSLAARQPSLSPYAESKRAGECAMLESFAGGWLTILRPPVVYGPWDRGALSIFRAASRRIVPIPGAPEARIAMIHVTDAAAAIAALAAWTGAPRGACYALADHNPAGYSPADILQIAAAALGNTPRFVWLPSAALRLGGHLASLAKWGGRRPGFFSAGKAREMLYPAWSIAPQELLPAKIATPAIELRRGFGETADWYRQAGWLA